MDTNEWTYRRNFGRDFKGEEKLRMSMLWILEEMNASSRMEWTLISNAVSISSTIRILNVVLDLVSYNPGENSFCWVVRREATL